MRKHLIMLFVSTGFVACQKSQVLTVTPSASDLSFDNLASTWDEGMPLGNATVGQLIWGKEGKLRFSLDRTDLWDLRPVDSLAGDNYKFSWVQHQVRKGDYLPVQKKFDHPYDRMPAPSKIPGAGLEFSLEGFDATTSNTLFIENALCEVAWGENCKLQTFVHATKPIGWFRIANAPEGLKPQLVAPAYERKGNIEDLGPVTGLDLVRLGYKQGEIKETEQLISYHQKGWDNYYYDVAVKWDRQGKDLVGVWSITTSLSKDKAQDLVNEAFSRGIIDDYAGHLDFWESYWEKSSVSLPDPILQKQYDNEMYKFASATREDSYPISLQAVWTADNGKLPPWKGDYHHDLNTQLSYWPTYIGNHLDLGLGYINTLWSQKPRHEKLAKEYFGVSEGFNAPGVATLIGEPMGGWIQYALSPTTAGWLAQHFYLHYKYSMDRTFLKEKAYPYLSGVAKFLEQITIINKEGVRTLEISSSPEIFDNSINAWFKTITNYDLALIRFCFQVSSELASHLNLTQEAAHWQKLYNEMGHFELDANKGLNFAKGLPYDKSHRHFSHAMAFHPLGLIDWSQGEESREIIRGTIENIDKMGSDYWTGYTFSWLGNMKARAMDGDGAAEALRTFAECFCLRNTFHANGDQSGTGKSKFTYRPFTLEGNFAFASGIQEMLLQSHTGVIRLFPAIPSEWKEVGFDKLRAMGAFVISAQMTKGQIKKVKIYPEQGGICRLELANPKSYSVEGAKAKVEDNLLIIQTEANKPFTLTRK